MGHPFDLQRIHHAAYRCRDAKVTVVGVPDRPGISATLFEPLADANVNDDMSVQNT